jgi:hypothetical protein
LFKTIYLSLSFSLFVLVFLKKNIWSYYNIMYIASILDIYISVYIFIIIYLFLKKKKIILFIYLLNSLTCVNIIPLNKNLLNGIMNIHPFVYMYLYIYFHKTNFHKTNFYKNILYIIFLLLFLGSYWAAQELSWGGWWSWDIIESTIALMLVVGLWLFHFKINFFFFKKILERILVFFFVFNKISIINSVHSFSSLSEDNYLYIYIFIFLLYKLFLLVPFISFFISINLIFYENIKVFFLFVLFFFLFYTKNIFFFITINFKNFFFFIKNIQYIHILLVYLLIFNSTIFSDTYIYTYTYFIGINFFFVNDTFQFYTNNFNLQYIFKNIFAISSNYFYITCVNYNYTIIIYYIYVYTYFCIKKYSLKTHFF